MKDERWWALMEDDSLPLTDEEILQGWHFCPDWDGLLIGPGMGEWDGCMCPRRNRRVREIAIRARATTSHNSADARSPIRF